MLIPLDDARVLWEDWVNVFLVPDFRLLLRFSRKQLRSTTLTLELFSVYHISQIHKYNNDIIIQNTLGIKTLKSLLKI